MRILIANDDGYLAPGLAALVQVMQGLGTIDVIAPEQNASGTSNALSLHRPLSLYHGINGFRYINGTPSDCVHVALTGVLAERPDLVLSGINNGANMGDDTDERSRAILEQMRADEIRHGSTGRSLGAAELPAPVKAAMKLVSKAMTRSAYRF